MGQLNFQTTGQALVIASSTATLYTDAAYSSPVTLPAAYAADTALYTREGSPTIVVTQPDGTVLFNGQVQVGTVYPAVLKPLPTFEQIAADASRSQAFNLTTGEETLPREFAASNAASSSGVLWLTPFIARKTEAITQVKMITGSTAAGATPTLCRMGFYQYAADGSISLVAAHANDTALFAATFTTYTKTLTSTFNKVAGQKYALGFIVVTGAAAPTFAGINTVIGSEAGLAPAISQRVTGQSDLPASVAAGSILSNNARFYGVALP